MSSFRICPTCKAYNTVHVVRCYKCSGDLPLPQIHTVAAREEESSFRAIPADDRGSERTAVGVLGAVIESNGEVRHDVMIENISLGGLLFHSDTLYHPFDRFLVLVPITGENYVVEATVKRSENVGFTLWRYATGVEFVDPPKEFKNRIKMLCAGIGVSEYSFA